MSFLVVGNITKDRLKTKSGERSLFGGTSFAGINASKLGYRSNILTKGNHILKDWIDFLEEQGVHVYLQEDKHVASFINDYSNIERKQSLLESTDRIVYNIQEEFDIIHLNPIYQEISPDLIENVRKRCDFLSLDVQGLVRNVKGRTVREKFWAERSECLKHLDLLKVGKNEVNFVSHKKEYKKICKDLNSLGVKIIALTFGEGGSIIYDNGFYRIPAFKTNTVDETGAGDVYGSSFAIRYFETKDVIDSALFASASASFVVENFGIEGIRDRRKVEKRCVILKEKFQNMK